MRSRNSQGPFCMSMKARRGARRKSFVARMERSKIRAIVPADDCPGWRCAPSGLRVRRPMITNLTLPRWAYVPGVETEADHDTLAMAKALVPARFNGFVPARHPALRYGLGLNDSGFFWESHEILEAVWAAAPQGGRERIFKSYGKIS